MVDVSFQNSLYCPLEERVLNCSIEVGRGSIASIDFPAHIYLKKAMATKNTAIVPHEITEASLVTQESGIGEQITLKTEQVQAIQNFAMNWARQTPSSTLFILSAASGSLALTVNFLLPLIQGGLFIACLGAMGLTSAIAVNRIVQDRKDSQPE